MEIVVHLYENNFGITFMAWSFTFKIFQAMMNITEKIQMYLG